MFTLIEHRFLLPIPRVSMHDTIQAQLVGEQCYMKVFNLQIFDLLSELDSLLALVLPFSIPSQTRLCKREKGNNGSTSWHKRDVCPLEEGCSLVSVHTSTFHVSRIWGLRCLTYLTWQPFTYTMATTLSGLYSREIESLEKGVFQWQRGASYASLFTEVHFTLELFTLRAYHVYTAWMAPWWNLDKLLVKVLSYPMDVA